MIEKMINESVDVKNKVKLKLSKKIEESANLIISSLKKGNKVLIAGNGGSAADAQHFAAELVGRFRLERKALPCIALTTDTSIITAWANDYNFETLFERQIEALGKEGDMFIGISTSGNSQNIIKAIKKSKELGLNTIALLGKEGGKTKGLADMELIIPSDNTPRIQESQIMILHIICELIENSLFEK